VCDCDLASVGSAGLVEATAKFVRIMIRLESLRIVQGYSSRSRSRRIVVVVVFVLKNASRRQGRRKALLATSELLRRTLL
jgi:hypothetical protein